MHKKFQGCASDVDNHNQEQVMLSQTLLSVLRGSYVAARLRAATVFAHNQWKINKSSSICNILLFSGGDEFI